MNTQNQYVYAFTKGDGKNKQLLGGKGANLCEMTQIGLNVPPGFTITPEACLDYLAREKVLPPGLMDTVHAQMAALEQATGKLFGDAHNPPLVSVRSGSAMSMPGMMETVLNVGLTEKTIAGLIKQSGGNARFVYDAYRRLIMMYSDVVMEKAAGIEPKDDQGIRKQLERIMDAMKKEKGVKGDTDLTTDDLKKLCGQFKARIKEVLKKEFPDNPSDLS